MWFFIYPHVIYMCVAKFPPNLGGLLPLIHFWLNSTVVGEKSLNYVSPLIFFKICFMASTFSILANDPCGFEKAVCSAAPWFILDLCKLGQNCVSVNCVFQNFYILSDFWLPCAISNKRVYLNLLCLLIWLSLLWVLPILLYIFC